MNWLRANTMPGVRNARKACESWRDSVLPLIRALRDVTLSQLDEHQRILPPKVIARCRHVITENARVQNAVAAIHSGDSAALGPFDAGVAPQPAGRLRSKLQGT